MASPSTAQLEQNRSFMDRYSRQIGTFGLDAMIKLVQMKVLLIGLKGVGAEVAKNITLAGLHTICLHDRELVQARDLGSNFFLTPTDVGKPRGEATAPRLAELNPNVFVQVSTGELTEEFVSQFDVLLVTTGMVKKELIRWNEFCRSRTVPSTDETGNAIRKPAPISFIFCKMTGVTGSIFVDHGPGFVLRDDNGKEPLVKLVSSIEKMEEKVDGVVRKYSLVRYITPDGQPPGSLPDGTLVKFSQVEGMYALDDIACKNHGLSINHSHPWVSTHPESDPVNSLRISDTTMFSNYVTGGILTEVKRQRVLPFRSLAECLLKPSLTPTGVCGSPDEEGFVMVDLMSQFGPGGIEQQLHMAILGLIEFESTHGRSPKFSSPEDVAECVSMAKKVNDLAAHMNAFTVGANYPFIQLENFDDSVPKRVASYASVELQPLCAFFGGIVAQELVKLSGKFSPIHQWFHFHSFDIIPEVLPVDTQPLNSRYDDQIAIFGKKFHDELSNLRLFMVGCGALGCEFAKNFAMMGVCCGERGSLVITDNDRIEISNLSRQFLFREDNVGWPKSVAASKRVVTMNQDMKVEAKQDLVGTSTEHIFDDAFWESLDVVCNALDNMQARFYVDSKCIFHEKPLLESGTLGTSASFEVVVPFKTSPLSDGVIPKETGDIPMCTIRNFPHLIEHCCEWARAKFADLFVEPARQLERLVADPHAFVTKQRSESFDLPHGSSRTTALAKAVTNLTLLRDSFKLALTGATVKDCVQLAFVVFHSLFRDNILDLIHVFPQNYTNEKGEKFWSGHKRFPCAEEFNFENPLHVEFIVSTANLFASLLKVHPAKYPSEQNAKYPDRWMSQFRTFQFVQSSLQDTPVPSYTPNQVGDLGDQQNAASSSSEGDLALDARFLALLADLEQLAIASKASSLAFEAADFEKDDDDNFHIDFITATSNLRGHNYHIPPASRHRCKMIAGRIIPAVATTTASVTGLVMLELYKLLLQRQGSVQFKSGNFDLGANTFTFFEASNPKAFKTRTETVIAENEFQDAVSAFRKRSTQLLALKGLVANIQSAFEETFGNDEESTEEDGSLLSFELLEQRISKKESELVAPDLAQFTSEETLKIYPSPHTRWDKIQIPPAVKEIADLEKFFKDEHNLELRDWVITTPEGKGVTLYPPEPELNLALLPPQDLSENQAMRALNSNATIPSNLKNKYLGVWRQIKAGGEPPKTGKKLTTLRDLISEKGLIPLSKRRKIILDGLSLEDEDGDDVSTATIVLNLE